MKLASNPLLNKDSYKLSHSALYPEGISGMSAYIEARKPDELITFFGLQMYLLSHLIEPINMAHVEEAATFAAAHGEPFNRAAAELIVNVFAGIMPVKIWAVPEGLRVPSGLPLVRIECEHPQLFWLAMDLETALQRAVWMPSTVASNDYKNRRMLSRYILETSDNPGHVDFMLHDFGGRGVSSEETAQLAGAAHLVYFNGSDTISGVRAANHYYNSPMAAFSVPAAEHSVQCAYGPMGQVEYLAKVLGTYAKPGAIVSVVLDGYDTFREVERLCTQFHDTIVASGAKIVFRPDSGDPNEIVPRILRLQDTAFGHKVNSKGFKTINHVGIIQGDGVDFNTMNAVLNTITQLGYSADNLVFGSGGALLQKVNRDTYGFAQKASAIKLHGRWTDIYKDPPTDPSKRSKAGRLTLLRSKMNGEFMTGTIVEGTEFDSEFEDMMCLVWDKGVMDDLQTMDQIRKLARG